MTVHDDYQRARSDALAFLTSLHAADPETAADVFEDTPDQALVAYVLAVMLIESYREIQRLTGWSVADALKAMGIANAEMA